jgi:predicted naringenin-chalcone synthase
MQLINKEQASWSRCLYRHGNMSSATVPHIFNENQRFEYTGRNKIVAMAFGPGLTATGLLLKKYKYRIEYKPIKKHSSTDNLE